MTKKELTELVMERVESKIYVDNILKPAFVNLYLAAAANYVQLKQYYISRQDNEALKEMPDTFLVVTNDVAVVYDDVSERQYIVMPAKIVNLPNGRGVKFIGPSAGKSYIPITQNQVTDSVDALKYSSEIFYQLEMNKAYFYNKPTSPNKLTVKQLGSVDDLDDNEEVPLPGGMEWEVINIMVEFFLGKRQLPEDTVNDQRQIPTGK